MSGDPHGLLPAETAPTVGHCEDGLEREIVRLYEAAGERMFRYALTVISDSGAVEDAIQESFLRYFLVRQAGRNIESPRAWLFRVLRNQLLDARRRSETSRRADLEDAAGKADRRQDPESDMQGAEMSRRMRAVLTVREMECLSLRMEGMNYLEIGAALGIRPGTVAALLARALKKVQALLRPEKEA